jgi:hypothetical protein
MKGFTLEIVLNSQSEMGALESGSVAFSQLAVVKIAVEDDLKEGNSAEGNRFGDRCITKVDFQFFDNSLNFGGLEFVGNKGKAQGNPEPLHKTYTFSLLQCNLCLDDL